MTTLTGRGRLTQLATTAAVLLAALPSMAAAAAPPTTTGGGADLVSIRDTGSGPQIRIRDATEARRQQAGTDPAALTLQWPGTAATIPAGAQFSFLGTAGQPVWAMATAGAEPYWDTTATPGPVTITAEAVEGPGRFASYSLSPTGEPSAQLTGEKSSFTLPAGMRQAAIWVFTAPGTYTIKLSATTKAGKAGATYRVAVPADGFSATPASAGVRALPERQAAPPPAAAVQAAATVATGRKVFTEGHVDVGPQLSGNAWTIRMKDDSASPAVWRNLSDVVLHAVDKAKIQVPADPSYAFLGSPGATVWLLPQVQQSGVVWPGWNTQDPSVVSGARGDTAFRLTAVRGPGQFKLFTTGAFGAPQVLFDSAKPLPQSMNIPPNTHAHGSWAFTTPGIYRLSITMSGTSTGGSSLSDSKTLVFAVGSSTNPNDGFGGGGPGGSLPRTGDTWLIPTIGGGAILVVAGALLLLLSRRRRTPEPGKGV